MSGELFDNSNYNFTGRFVRQHTDAAESLSRPLESSHAVEQTGQMSIHDELKIVEEASAQALSRTVQLIQNQ